MANHKPQSQNRDEVHMNLRVPRGLHDRLRLIAENEDRTISQEVRRLIRERVEQAAA